MKYKKDDYFVCLEKPNSNPFMANYNYGGSDVEKGGAGYKMNFCFKIERISNTKIPILWPQPEGNGIYQNSVRKATKEEIAEYDRIGSFDVTNLIFSKAIKLKDCKYLLNLLKKLKL
jgi:hypothetical protein